MQDFATGRTPSILLMQNLRCWLRYWAAPAAASPPPRFQGDKSIAARLLLGEADRMGSTPLSNVIAVGCVLAVPCVATIITASPFCKSASATAGIRFSICWKSGGPPRRKFPALPPGVLWPGLSADEAPPGAVPGATSGDPPRNRTAIR